jgi:hypothetical protein
MAARKRGEMPAEFDGLPCGHSCCAIMFGSRMGYCAIAETQARLAGYEAYHAEAGGDEPQLQVDIRTCLELMVAHERSLAAQARYAAAFADSPVRALSRARRARAHASAERCSRARSRRRTRPLSRRHWGHWSSRRPGT